MTFIIDAWLAKTAFCDSNIRTKEGLNLRPRQRGHIYTLNNIKEADLVAGVPMHTRLDDINLSFWYDSYT